MEQKDLPTYLLTYDHGGYILWGEHFKERLDSAIDWLEKYPSFKLGLDNESFAYDQYAETQPEIIAFVKEKLQAFAGRLAIGSSTYGQPLSVFVNEESNVRQLTYAIRANLKHFGQTPAVYAVSEHALHSQIPQLVSLCGYRAAVMRTHFMMYGYNPTYSVGYGTWEGVDGTEIATVPTYDGEGAEFGMTTYDNWVLTRWPDQADRSLEDFVAKFPDICPLLASRYDDIVLRCEGLTQYVEARRDQYQWILLEEIPALFGEPQMKFAPGANEFVVRMPWGYCGNQIFNGCRQGELSVLTAERLNAWAVLAGGELQQNLLEESWKKLLVTQHHDIQICGLLEDKERFLSRSLQASRQVAESSLAYLSQQFETDGDRYVMVYNPLSYPVRQTVEHQVSYPRGKGGTEFSLWFGAEEIPCEYEALDYKAERISRLNLRFTVSVPAQSIRCYRISTHAGRLSEQATRKVLFGEVIETPEYTLELDEGGIRTLRKGSACWFCREQGALFAGVIDEKSAVSHGSWSVASRGSLIEAEYLGHIGTIGIQFTMTLAGRRIDCRVKFIHHGEKIGSAAQPESFKDNQNGFVHEDKLRFLLPLQLGEAFGVRDLPFLVEETDDRYIQGNYWTACGDGRIGIACFNRGSMCMVREQEGVSIPLEYANDYVWGSRALYGEIEHEFALLPYQGDWKMQDLHRAALAYAYPLAAYPVASDQKGVWRKEIAFLQVKGSENVLLSALYPEGDSIIVRVYEVEGKDGSVMISSPFATVEEEVNLLGEPMGDYRDAFPIKAHKIHSFRMRKGGDSCG